MLENLIIRFLIAIKQYRSRSYISLIYFSTNILIKQPRKPNYEVDR